VRELERQLEHVQLHYKRKVKDLETKLEQQKAAAEQQNDTVTAAAVADIGMELP